MAVFHEFRCQSPSCWEQDSTRAVLQAETRDPSHHCPRPVLGANEISFGVLISLSTFLHGQILCEVRALNTYLPEPELSYPQILCPC